MDFLGTVAGCTKLEDAGADRRVKLSATDHRSPVASLALSELYHRRLPFAFSSDPISLLLAMFVP